jgi:hypothetical protein
MPSLFCRSYVTMDSHGRLTIIDLDPEDNRTDEDFLIRRTPRKRTR